MPILVGEFGRTKLPKKLLEGLFLSSQVMKVQGDDDSTGVTQHEEKCEGGFVCLCGFVSGVLAMVFVRFVADYMIGGRYAEPPVICVEVGTKVDMLAFDEELVDDLNSQLTQPEVALAGLFGRFLGVRARKTVTATGHSMRMLTT